MYITRLRVENEGFLAGLDVPFTPGLNVIIGARGTGKTSLIELIRFCLQAGSFTEEAAQRGHQQALAVLNGAAVTVDLFDPVSQAGFTVTRSASGHGSSTLPAPASVTVLAQNEVEAVGAQAGGRLHLVDRLRPGRQAAQQEVDRLRLQLRSLTTEVNEVLREALDLAAKLTTSDQTSAQLNDARQRQLELLESAKASREDTERLEQYQNLAGVLASHEARTDQAKTDIEDLAQLVARAQGVAHKIAQSWGIDEPDPNSLFSAALPALRQAAAGLDQAREHVRRAGTSLDENQLRLRGTRADLEHATRDIRQRLSALQEGVGAATRRVDELEEAMGQVTAMARRFDERKERFQLVSSERDDLYRQLDRIRGGVFNERRLVAESLTQQLAPHVRVSVERSAVKDDYASTIVAALRGSGLHYNSLAPRIASQVAPFELATWVERGDADSLSEALGIGRDRCVAIVNSLRESGVSEIIAARIEDRVTLELLDGRDYKSSDRLSIGQRCTVILPMLFGSHGDPLLIDQPEDHLDNAFIASTLVKTLRSRGSNDQYILTSHNPNIPVLGEADQIIAMESDGRRGFVRVRGPLEAPEVVRTVTSLMEGGAEAFARRASFYRNAN